MREFTAQHRTLTFPPLYYVLVIWIFHKKTNHFHRPESSTLWGIKMR